MTKSRETFNEWAKSPETFMLEFTYHGRDGNIDPYWTLKTGQVYHLYYNAYGNYDDRNEKDVHSFKDVMNDPFFDGRALKDIIDDLQDVGFC